MKYRSFGGTLVSEVSLGTWQLGNADWGNVREEDAFAILDNFIQLGGNFIDTADVYGAGISEKVIGRFLKTTDKQLYVATKLGRRSDGDFGWPQNFGYEQMRQQVERSLTNLGLSTIFLEQLHCIPFEVLKAGDVFHHLRRLADEKLIAHWGVSVETTEEALFCLEQEGLSSLQVIFNLFRQHVADELFEKAAEKGVSLIIRVPLASGLLTGKFTGDTRFSDNDHRNYNAQGKAFNAGETFSGIDFPSGVAWADEMNALMPDERKASWAIRWILDHPQVTTVIPGASRVEQVESNMAASALAPLGMQTRQQLRDVYDQKIRAAIRGHY
jgi:aryl-alcohol dehydrogenase-like predicted oxidoreductase